MWLLSAYESVSNKRLLLKRMYLAFLIIEFLYVAYYRKISRISKDFDGTIVRAKTKRPIAYLLNREANSLRRNLYDSDKW